MQILIIDAYEQQTNKGIIGFKSLRRAIQRALKDCRITESNLITRKVDQLSDYCVDWNNGILDENSKSCARLFDKLDMIFVGGDMKCFPWDPICSQLVTVLHMANSIHKAMFTCGSGAHSQIYSLCTQGSKYHMLNGPDGGMVDDLPTFPRYSISTGAYPSGFLDNETGDIYTFDSKMRWWRPKGNVGMYRIASRGKPTSARLRTPRKSYSRDDNSHLVNASIEPVENGEDVVHIRNRMLHHFSVKKLGTQNFVVSLLPNWYLNEDTGLPTHTGLVIIADCEHGPVLLSHSNSVMFACEVAEGRGQSSSQQILTNFVSHTVEAMTNSKNNQIHKSIYNFLYGRDGLGGTYDTLADRISCIPMNSLASAPIATTLITGPVKVDPPVIAMFFTSPSVNQVDYRALTSARRHSTVGKKPKSTVQNPVLCHSKRMGDFLTRAGHKSTLDIYASVVAQQQGTLDPFLVEQATPTAVKELFSGIEMDNRNISRRRYNNNSPYDEYVAAGLRRSQGQSHSGALAHDGNCGVDNDNDNDDCDGPQTITPGFMNKPPSISFKPVSSGSATNINDNDSKAKTRKNCNGVYDHHTGKLLPPPKHDSSNNTSNKTPSVQQQSQTDMHQTQTQSRPHIPLINNWERVSNTSYVPSSCEGDDRPATNSMSARGATPLSGRLLQQLQPVNHPKSARDAIIATVTATRRHSAAAQGGGGGGGEAHKVNLDSHRGSVGSASGVSEGGSGGGGGGGLIMPVPPRVVMLRASNSTKPFSLHKKFEQLGSVDLNEEDGKYVGHYTTTYMDIDERARKEYMKAKEKFISGAFKNASGVASQMPLRKEGLVRPQGPYPRHPGHGVVETAEHWGAVMKR